MNTEASDAPVRMRGHTFEDFAIGRVFNHHWGRTILQQESFLFATMLLQLNPSYFNETYAQSCGHETTPICPMLVFSTVFGLSVEDLSERGGAFLGIDNLLFEKTVYPGDTLTAKSTVLERRISRSKPGFGIVTWRTEGYGKDGARVIVFDRTNMVVRRNPQEGQDI